MFLQCIFVDVFEKDAKKRKKKHRRYYRWQQWSEVYRHSLHLIVMLQVNVYVGYNA